MARKVSKTAAASKRTKHQEGIAPDNEPRLARDPNADEIWRRVDARGIRTAELDAALTGRADRGYALARKHTHPRDGSRYVRFPRTGHLIIWAEKLGISLSDAARLFGYDVPALEYSATVVGHTDMQGTITPRDHETVVVLDQTLNGALAAHVLAPLPAFGLPAHATLYWHNLDDVPRYVAGRLCMVRRLPSDARRIAWVIDAPGRGAPAAYAFADGTLHRGALHSCEVVRQVVHPAGAS